MMYKGPTSKSNCTMSFVDLATLTMHRRSEMEARIAVLVEKCDEVESHMNNLKMQAHGFVEQLNCDPSELKERFLNCMKQLDEYIYVVTDINLSFNSLEENANADNSQVDQMLYPVPKAPPQPPQHPPAHLLDVLPLPSTSTPMTSRKQCCPDVLPKEKKRKAPKEDILIEFSSASCSQESVPEVRCEAKEVQCNELPLVPFSQLAISEPEESSLPGASTHVIGKWNLPAQSLLQPEMLYQGCIMHVSGASLWIITDQVDTARQLMVDMSKFYRENSVKLSRQELMSLTYCAYYDDDSDCSYRCLFLNIDEENSDNAKLFLVDTGEVRSAPCDVIQPLAQEFCVKPPFARCCHLAGIELVDNSEEMLIQVENFVKQYIGALCEIEVDDNTSESLGVYICLPTKELLNQVLVAQRFAVPADKSLYNVESTSDGVHYDHVFNNISGPSHDLSHGSSHEPSHGLSHGPSHGLSHGHSHGPSHESSHGLSHGPSHGPTVGPPEMVPTESELEINECPEYEDPLEAVTGYHNRDEEEICKYYKGGPEKTCFKGARCKKRHVMLHPGERPKAKSDEMKHVKKNTKRTRPFTYESWLRLMKYMDGWTLDRVPVSARGRCLPLPQPGSVHAARVTCVCHFDHVYVHFQWSQPEECRRDFGVVLPPTSLATLERDMNSAAGRAAHRQLKLAPAPGELVAALYPLDNLWYRASVLSLDHAQQQVEVRYVDYGTEMWVKENNIRELDLAYTLLPIQAIKCKLAGVEAISHLADDWVKAKKALTMLTEDRILDCRIIARNYDELEVELYDEEQGNIAEKLEDMKLVKRVDYEIVDDTRCELKHYMP